MKARSRANVEVGLAIREISSFCCECLSFKVAFPSSKRLEKS